MYFIAIKNCHSVYVIGMVLMINKATMKFYHIKIHGSAHIH